MLTRFPPLALATLLLLAVPAETVAKTVTYAARAVTAIIPGASPLEDLSVGPDDQIRCEDDVETCFEIPARCSALPVGSCLVGGARGEHGAPQVTSRAAGLTLPLGLLTIQVPWALAVADGRTGELFGRSGVLALTLPTGQTISLEAGDLLEIPGVGTLLAGVERRGFNRGVAVIEKIGALIILESGEEIVVSRAVAGVRTGSGAGSGCSVAGEDGRRPDATVLALLFLLPAFALRSRMCELAASVTSRALRS